MRMSHSKGFDGTVAITSCARFVGKAGPSMVSWSGLPSLHGWSSGEEGTHETWWQRDDAWNLPPKKKSTEQRGEAERRGIPKEINV